MATTVQTTVRSGATVVRLSGSIEPDLLAPISRGLASVAGTTPVLVVDMNDLVLLRPDLVQAMAIALREVAPGRVRLVCNRLSARRLLRRWGGPDLAVFESVDTALARFPVSA